MCFHWTWPDFNKELHILTSTQLPAKFQNYNCFKHKSDNSSFLKDYNFQERLKKTWKWLNLHQQLCLQPNWLYADGGEHPPWPNLTESWKAQGLVLVGIHVENLAKSFFFQFERKIKHQGVKKVFLITCTLSPQQHHENEVWNSPQCLDTRSTRHNGMKGFTLSVRFLAWTRTSTEAGQLFFSEETSNSFA